MSAYFAPLFQVPGVYVTAAFVVLVVWWEWPGPDERRRRRGGRR